MNTEAITGWDVYWITRLDGIWNACIWMMVVGCVAAIFAWILWVDELAPKRLAIAMTCVPIIGFFGAVFVPTTRQAIAIVVVPKIANNEDVQGLGKDMIDTAREWMRDLREEKKK